MPVKSVPRSEEQLRAQRAFAESIVRRLRDAGFVAYFAGGCVRDQLLGRTPVDFDVATNAPPDRVRALFPRGQTQEVGSAFGVVLIRPPRRSGLQPVEVATFRREFEYRDGRHPDRVEFTDAKTDAQRRDFTINGLFYDPIKGRVIDHVDGQEDLRRGIVRAIGNPDKRFDEDKLRMLRAVRIAAALNFRIDPETAQAIRRHAHELVQVSAERIADELRRMLVHPTRARAVELCHECGLLAVIVPELSPILPPAEFARAAAPEFSAEAPDNGGTRAAEANEPTPSGCGAVAHSGNAESRTAWEHTLHTLDALGRDPRTCERFPGLAAETAVSFSTAMAGLLYEVRDRCDVAALGRRLRFSNDEIRAIRWLLLKVPLVLAAPSVVHPPGAAQARETHEGSTPSTSTSGTRVELADLRIVLADEKAEDLLQLLWAVEQARTGAAAAWNACLDLLRSYTQRPLLPPPLITGDDLRALGYRPGPAFARALEAARRAQLNEHIADRDAALRIARSVLEDARAAGTEGQVANGGDR